jgi:hypothetical protein
MHAALRSSPTATATFVRTVVAIILFGTIHKVQPGLLNTVASIRRFCHPRTREDQYRTLHFKKTNEGMSACFTLRDEIQALCTVQQSFKSCLSLDVGGNISWRVHDIPRIECGLDGAWQQTAPLSVLFAPDTASGPILSDPVPCSPVTVIPPAAIARLATHILALPSTRSR